MSDSYPFTAAQRQTAEILDQSAQTMMAAIYRVMEETKDRATADLQEIDPRIRTPGFEYFGAVALENLFCRQCGADVETGEGGDPRLAALLLEKGREMSSRFSDGEGGQMPLVAGAASEEMTDERKSDRFGVADGAYRLACGMVLQALIENASTSDPAVRSRIVAGIDDYITRLAPQSELERDFVERARTFVEGIISRPV